jgi:hypothetical protein
VDRVRSDCRHWSQAAVRAEGGRGLIWSNKNGSPGAGRVQASKEIGHEVGYGAAGVGVKASPLSRACTFLLDVPFPMGAVDAQS